MAGLNIFMTVIAFLFVIGIFIALGAITNQKIQEASWEETTADINETLSAVGNTTAVEIASTGWNCGLTSVVIHNTTEGGTLVPASNYTVSDCTVVLIAPSIYTDEDLHIIATKTYDADTDGSLAVNDTTTALADAVDWFTIIIVISAMIVIILLIGIIFATIRGTGMAGEGGSGFDGSGGA